MRDASALVPLTDVEFAKLRTLVKDFTGISLAESKRTLLVSRLASRLRVRGLATFLDYYKLITSQAEQDEFQTAIDLITTNETSFFRESEHFRVLRDYIGHLRPVPFPFRVWSAASSSGEEAYTIGMVLSEVLGSAEWEVLGTDISTRVLDRARRGIYPMERASTIPIDMLHRHCLKGQGSHQGLFRIGQQIRDRVQFMQMNLCRPFPAVGRFDVIFLRNVLIYFETEQKRKVVEALATCLKPGGLLLVGHSESLNGITSMLTPIQPTVYRVA
nr:CheR family methyltransferase [uncultured Holophaga sp.]